MFTGIIEEQGTIKSMRKMSERSITMTIGASEVLEDVAIGDSIAVNGTCLTVTNFTSRDFSVDVMPETVKATSLNSLGVGSDVNLERAMAANGRFGGHFVSGHIDGVGKIVKKQKQENAIYYEIHISGDTSGLILKKGSIAVDGISLTVFEASATAFTISLIPHTVSETTLGNKQIGDIVNIEYDMLGKYVQQMLQDLPADRREGINASFLKENGFIAD